MQITLPSPDGQNQIITGPYQIKMQLAHNSSPPIQGTEGLTKKIPIPVIISRFD